MRTEDIVERVTNAIVQHRLLPGAKLNEQELASVFKVSRTIVRQALIRLANDKLVSIGAKRVATVARPGLEEAHHLFEALAAFERCLLDVAGREATPKDIAKLRRHVARQRAALEKGSKRLADELGIRFHVLLAELTRNPVLQEIQRELSSRQQIITALYKTEFNYCQLCDEHDGIIDCLEAGTVERAREMLESHYRLVIKGYRLDDVQLQSVDLAQALAV